MMKKYLLIACCLIVAFSIAGQKKNRYGMEIEKRTDGTCKIKKQGEIEKIIDLSQVADLCVPYVYKPDKIQGSDYEKCTTKEYIFKDYGTYSLSMEVDIPSGMKGPFPFIIYVHGGSWISGGPSSFKNQSQYLASRGIAGIRITYTLQKNNGHFEQGLEEIDEAFRFTQAHAKEWNLDMKRFGYAGGSAGTPLSSYWAMKKEGCSLYIGCNGLYDLTEFPPAGNFPGKDRPYLRFIDSQEKAREMSSVYQIPKKNPPAVMVAHGTADTTIPYQQAVALCDAVAAKGGKINKLIYPYYVHAFFNKNASDKYEEITMEMYRFSKEIFKLK